MIFSGDANEEPHGKAIKELEGNRRYVDLYEVYHTQEAKLKQKPPQKGVNLSAPAKVEPAKKYPDFTLIADCSGGDKPKPETKHLTLDYMMVDSNSFQRSNPIQVQGLLDLPAKQPGDATAIPLTPGNDHPSDHFSLVYDVEIGYDAQIKGEIEKSKKSMLAGLAASLGGRVKNEQASIEQKILTKQRWADLKKPELVKLRNESIDKIKHQLADGVKDLNKEKKKAKKEALLERKKQLLAMIDQ